MTEFSIRHDPLKRGFDILFSSVFLICGAPVLLLIGLLVALTSKGPVVYHSLRLGRGGCVIACLKFRTMYENADELLEGLLKSDPSKQREWDQFQKLKSDPRITPVGKFLRAASIDEALQFWNVLKGDLSVVGPRPPTLIGTTGSYLDEIKSIYGNNAATILSVRPGITGIWQVSGRSEVPLAKRQKMETDYVQTRTFWTDLIVIAKTIPAVLFSKGAF